MTQTPTPPLASFIVGIDPGLSGAIAFINSSDCSICDMPTLALSRGGKNKREIDAHSLASTLSQHKPQHAFVEKVGAMPGQGVSSVFAFGRAYGIIIGILAALQIPVTFVAPQRWKKALGVPAAKDGARARASQLLPAAAHQWPLVKHDGRAESALIGLYGLQQAPLYDANADAEASYNDAMVEIRKRHESGDDQRKGIFSR